MQAPRLSAKDSRSIRETDILLKKGLVTKEELLALYNHHYKMTLRVAGRFIDTSVEDDPLIYVVTHAAVDIDTIRKAAEYLDPDEGGYAINSFPRLMKMMDVVDKKFQLVVDGNWVHELWDPKAMKNAYEKCCDLRNDPFVRSMWNRVYEGLSREECQLGFRIRYIHCHDSLDPGVTNSCNLDNRLGKTADDSIGQYSIIYVTKHELPLEFVNQYQFYSGTVVAAHREAQLAVRANETLFDMVQSIESSSDDESEPAVSLQRSIVTLQRGRLFSHAPYDGNDEGESSNSVSYPSVTTTSFFQRRISGNR